MQTNTKILNEAPCCLASIKRDHFSKWIIHQFSGNQDEANSTNKTSNRAEFFLDGSIHTVSLCWRTFFLSFLFFGKKLWQTMNAVPLFNAAWLSWWTIIAVRMYSYLWLLFWTSHANCQSRRLASCKTKEGLLTNSLSIKQLNIFSCHPKAFGNTREVFCLLKRSYYIFIKGCRDPRVQTCIAYPAYCCTFHKFFHEN